MTTSNSTPLVILFDDERNFQPGFRDDAVVLRTVKEAVAYFDGLKETGQRISELWLDFVLNPGSTYEALYNFPGELLDRALYQSSATGGKRLIEQMLQDAGFQGELELPAQAFPNEQLFL